MGRTEFTFSTSPSFGLNTTVPTSDTGLGKDDRPTRVTIEEWSDRELIAAVVLRNDAAYSELFRRHFNSVVQSSHMILADHAESEDVAADVLFEFWLEPRRFDPSRGTLLSFLRVKSKGRSIDLLRAETSRARREQRDADRARKIETGADMRVLSLESITRLRAAVAQLPPEEREPIELAFFGRLPYIAVAQHLGCPDDTVKARIRSGLGRLRLAGLAQDIARGQGVNNVKVVDPARMRNVPDHEVR